MKIGWKELILTIILAISIHIIIILSIPEIIMLIASHIHPGGLNRVHYSGLITSDSRAVVLPSPDLLYSSILYDVSQHPLIIRTVIPQHTYWSISLYNSRTDNYFSLNDTQATSKKLRIAVVSKKMRNAVENKGFDKIIEADSDRGMILFRMLIDDLENKNRVNELIDIQKQTTCSPLF